MIKETSMLSEKDILTEFSRQKDRYSPLEIVSVEAQPRAGAGYRPDAKVTLGWRGRKVVFLAEIKTRTAPRGIDQSLWQMKAYATQGKKNLLLVVPYLSKTIVEMLNREGLSGLDLNGNYLIASPEMMAIRLDQKNQFRESQPIRKIFSGNSSLVGRLFLAAKRRFASVNEVHSSILALGGSLSLSAVSKVLKGLEDELLIEKGAQGIALLQPEKLLQSLQDGYRPPKVSTMLKLKLPGTGLEALRKLAEAPPASARWILSGESSAQRYAVTTPAEVFTVYATGLGPLAQYEDERFYNVIVKEAADSFPYFDAAGLPWSSPVQCCLELSQLDKRERELAGEVAKSILAKLK